MTAIDVFVAIRRDGPDPKDGTEPTAPEWFDLDTVRYDRRSTPGERRLAREEPAGAHRALPADGDPRLSREEEPIVPRGAAKGPKRKKLSYRLIERESADGEVMYPMLEGLVEANHEHLDAERIALAWNFSWKPDVDGRLVLGKCKKATDLDRELAEFDFVIILNNVFWSDEQTTDAHRLALLDHELCHAAEKLDPETLDPVYDERGRQVFRTRKHDVEEFAEVVRRHGIWKADLELFALEIVASKQLPLLANRVADADFGGRVHRRLAAIVRGAQGGADDAVDGVTATISMRDPETGDQIEA